MFSCEICETFTNTFFPEHLRWLFLAIYQREPEPYWEPCQTSKIERFERSNLDVWQGSKHNSIADQKASINLLVSTVITHLKRLKNTGKTLDNKSSKENQTASKKEDDQLRNYFLIFNLILVFWPMRTKRRFTRTERDLFKVARVVNIKLFFYELILL